MPGEENSGAGAAAADQITGGAKPDTLLTGNKPDAGAKPDADAAAKPAEGDKKDDAKPADGDKKDGDKKDGDKKDGNKKDDKPAGAPEKYEAPKLPDGVTVDDVQLGEFDGLAKKLGFSQEARDAIIDHYLKIETARVEQVGKAWEARGKAWADDAKADKEIGGEKFEQSVSAAKQVLDKFGTPELVKDLVTYQMGNNPELIRLLNRVHAAVKDDTFVTGGKNTGAPQDVARTIFTTMKDL